MFYDIKASGIRIQKLRKKKAMTQEQLADKLNIATSTIGKIERGQQGLSIDLVIEIAMFFGVSLDYILLGREIQTDSFKRHIHDMVDQLLEIESCL